MHTIPIVSHIQMIITLTVFSLKYYPSFYVTWLKAEGMMLPYRGIWTAVHRCSLAIFVNEERYLFMYVYPIYYKINSIECRQI